MNKFWNTNYILQIWNKMLWKEIECFKIFPSFLFHLITYPNEGFKTKMFNIGKYFSKWNHPLKTLCFDITIYFHTEGFTSSSSNIYIYIYMTIRFSCRITYHLSDWSAGWRLIKQHIQKNQNILTNIRFMIVNNICN